MFTDHSLFCWEMRASRAQDEFQEETQMSFTKKQLKAINAKLKEIAGEPTDVQLKAIVRSVMLPAK
jgi:hypothetical protein